MADILATISEYMKYAPGVDASLSIDNLRPSSLSAKKKICAVIGDVVFVNISEANDDDESKKLLKGAWANLTMYAYKVFEAVNKRVNQGKEVYRYELDAMRKEYMNNFYAYIDGLIKKLESNEEFKKTRLYTLKNSVIIKSLEEFEDYYPIDSSYYFYYQLLPIQRKVIDEKISTSINLKLALQNQKHKKKVENAVVLYCISESLKMFDIYELPNNIKNTWSANRIATDKLYDDKWKASRIIELEKEADKNIASIERVQESDSYVSVNNESDKSYVL